MLKKIGRYELSDKIDKNDIGICYKANDNNKLYAY